jgi:uncharacterized protein
LASRRELGCANKTPDDRLGANIELVVARYGLLIGRARALDQLKRRPHTSAMNENHTEARGFQFPGTFEVTAFAEADAHFENQIATVLADAGVSVLTATLGIRASSTGRLSAIRISFLCPDRAHLENVHAKLKAHPAVKWTL